MVVKPQKKRRRKISTKEDALFTVVNITFLIVIIVVVGFPLLYVLSASFSNPIDLASSEFFIFPRKFFLGGYARVVGQKDLWMGYKNSILYTVVGTCVNLIMTAACAYPLSRKDLKGRNIFAFLFAFTMFFHGGLIPRYLLIRNLNMLDTFWVMIIPGAVGVTNMIIMRTYFQSTIPMELQESAMIDGCRNITLFIRIVLPLSKPVLAVLALYYGVQHWNEYFHALIFLSSEEKFPLQLILRRILIQSQSDAFEQINVTEGYMEQQLMMETLRYCVIVVSSVPVLFFYPYIQRYFVKGVMIGAIKG